MTSAHIAITMGDSKGVGPEVVVKAWNETSPPLKKYLRLYGNLSIFKRAADAANISLDERAIVETGHGNTPEQLALLSLQGAITAAKKSEAKALVTAPVNKYRLQTIVPHFTGHTSFLGQSFSVPEPVMFFVAPSMRVALVTHHLRLLDVPRAITRERVAYVIEQTHRTLTDLFGIINPAIAVMGLNPHAGENGLLGTEEKEYILPVVEHVRKQGMRCTGPFPADTLLAREGSGHADAVVAMYHDQGLIPVKLLHPDTAINMTLGLPIVRTSPAHGTAENIAGKNRADPSGMKAAIELAWVLTKKEFFS